MSYGSKRDGFGKPQHYYGTVCRKGNPHNNREKTCHRDGRILGRIDYPTTAAEILTYFTDQEEKPLAWQDLPFLPADITTYRDRKGR
jgi:hypothetical protein